MTTTAPAVSRPRLRGWLHAAAVPVAVFGAIVLWRSAELAASRVTVAIFGACLVGLYVASSVLHTRTWSARARDVLGRIDGAMIVLTIVGTFTPVGYHTLAGSWRTTSLAVAWTVALVAIALIASPLQVPRAVSGLLFVVISWLVVVPFTQIAATLPLAGNSLIVIGGMLYTVGALIYVLRWPDPLPRWFGYHEIFHVFVIAASTLHWFAIWRYVLPD